MDPILTPKFHAMDYCHRFEWQGTGSPHTHGFVWIDDDTRSQGFIKTIDAPPREGPALADAPAKASPSLERIARADY